MKTVWHNTSFFWKVYLSAILLIISTVFVAEMSEDAIPYVTDHRRLSHSELEALLDEYAGSGHNAAEWRERMRAQGIWLLDVNLASFNNLSLPAEGEIHVIDLLPDSDDWADEWVFVERLLPDGRLVAMGLPEPIYSDFLDAVLWFGIIAAFAGAGCYALSKFLSSRLSDIFVATRRLAAGDMKTRVAVAEEGGDEISDLGRLFNKMAYSVEQAMENERRLLYDISHEMRSPLARMQLAVELLRRNDKKSGEYMDMLEGDIARMTAMMNNIMEQDASTVISGAFLEEFDLCAMLDDVIELANFEMRKNGRNTHCALTLRPDAEVRIHAAQGLVEQAVQNLLGNALRYSPEGGQVDVLLELFTGRGDEGQNLEYARVTVRDYGPGVSVEHLPKLFRPFFRVEGARDQKSGGVGLGLALAAQYIKRHRGTIAASNSLPGLAVSVTLPLRPY